MDQLLSIKLVSFIMIFSIALLAGLFPFFNRTPDKQKDFPIGEALASGIFLGAGLIHMLGDASHDFNQMRMNYPFAFLIAGMVFLLLLTFEHWSQELFEKATKADSGFIFLSFIVLSFHSILEGSALGLGSSWTMVIVLMMAVLAHKWAASFAFAMQINKTGLSLKMGFILFISFCLMTPFGILLGESISSRMNHYSYIQPIFNSLAAGTFIYLGTLHGLSRSIMAKKNGGLKKFNYILTGFALMAVVAVWT